MKRDEDRDSFVIDIGRGRDNNMYYLWNINLDKLRVLNLVISLTSFINII